MNNEEISHPQQETGFGLSKQESCYDDKSHESNDEPWKLRDRKVWSPSRSDLAPLSTEEVQKSSSVVQIGGSSPTAPPPRLPQIKEPRESPENDSLGASKHAEQPRSAGGAEAGRSMMCETPAEAPLLTGSSKQPRKMAAGKLHKLGTWITPIFILTIISLVSGTSIQHYTCTNKERCPDLVTVYGQDDNTLYQGTVDEKILECDGNTFPASGNCTVCRDQDVRITCPVDTVPKEGEDSNGQPLTLEKIPPPPVEPPNKLYYLLILLVLPVIGIGAGGVVYRYYQKRKRSKNEEGGNDVVNQNSNSTESDSTPNHVSANDYMLPL